LLRIFLFGLPGDEPSHTSVAVFCAVDDFRLVIDFDNIRATFLRAPFMGNLCFSAVFFVDADLLQLQLYLYDVPDASTSFSDAVFNTVDAFLKCCIRC